MVVMEPRPFQEATIDQMVFICFTCLMKEENHSLNCGVN